MSDLPKPDFARNMRIVGYSDQGGRPDGVQLMVHRGFAYIGHMFSKGFSVVDVRNPKGPKPVNFFPAPPNTWNIHLQTHDDLLLVINAKDMFAAAEFADEKAYYKGQLGQVVGTADKKTDTARDWTAGMAVYDISDGANPKQIGFMPVAGGGIHRIWYAGGRWAYASALLDGFTDYIFITIDMANPKNPREAGRWWIPGMNTAAGEKISWSPTARFGLHHPIISGDTAYAAWRDAGMVVIDVADRAKPKLICHRDGRRRSVAARITACRCRTAICSSYSTKRCSIIKKTVRKTYGSTTTVTGHSPRSSPHSRNRARRTTNEKTAISARITCTRTGPAHSSRPI